MRNGGSKRKGNAFQNKVARLLSSWVTGGAREDAFVSSVLSGGQATAQYHSKGEVITTHQSGDLAMSHPSAAKFIEEFSIECKAYANVGLDTLVLTDKVIELRSDRKDLFGFWAQATEDASRAGKSPLLIFKQNNRPIMIGMCRELAHWLMSAYSAKEMSFRVDFLDADICITDLTHFFEVVHPENFIKFSRSLRMNPLK